MQKFAAPIVGAANFYLFGVKRVEIYNKMC